MVGRLRRTASTWIAAFGETSRTRSAVSPLPWVSFARRQIYCSRETGKRDVRHARFPLRRCSVAKHGLMGEILNTPLLLSRNISQKKDIIACIEFSKSHCDGFSRLNLTKSEIANQFGLRSRDLQDIDHTLDPAPRILVRPSSILVVFFDLRLLIRPNRVVMIEAQTYKESPTCSIFMYNFERFDWSRASELPFELRIVEAALLAVTSKLEGDLTAIRESVDKDLPTLDINDDRVQTKLLGLLEHSRTLGGLTHHAQMVQSAIKQVLDEDEDLAAMYLTDTQANRPHAIADHQEAEYLLETYFERTSSIVRSADVMLRNIRKTEETMNVVLDAKRNQIMVFEARLAILTVGLGAGTFIAGLFGMNLINYMEEAPGGFATITGISVMLVGGCTVILARLFRRIRRFRV